jgi:hypothetical protein
MIDRGRLSASRDESGRYSIDPAELERVFGTLSRDARTGVQNDAMHETARVNNALEHELAMLHERIEHDRTTHERERQTWEDERTFLRRLVEKQTDQLKLLTDARDKPRQWFLWWRRRQP